MKPRDPRIVHPGTYIVKSVIDDASNFCQLDLVAHSIACEAGGHPTAIKQPLSKDLVGPSHLGPNTWPTQWRRFNVQERSS